MKYIIFVGLKIVEIGVIVFLPYLVGKYAGPTIDQILFGKDCPIPISFWGCWVEGIFCIILPFGIIFTITAIVTLLVLANITLTQFIVKKISKKT